MNEPRSLLRPKTVTFAVNMLWVAMVISFFGYWMVLDSDAYSHKIAEFKQNVGTGLKFYLSYVPMLTIQIIDFLLAIIIYVNLRLGKIWARNLFLFCFALYTLSHAGNIALYPQLMINPDYLYSHVVWVLHVAAVILIITPPASGWFQIVSSRRANLDQQIAQFEKELDGDTTP